MALKYHLHVIILPARNRLQLTRHLFYCPYARAKAFRLMLGVALCRFQVFVAHVTGDSVNVDTILREPCPECVPQVMEHKVLNSRFSARLSEIPLDISSRYASAAARREHKAVLRAGDIHDLSGHPASKNLQHGFRYDRYCPEDLVLGILFRDGEFPIL
jgi:hypothetical protein